MKTANEFRPWGVILIHLAAWLIAASASRASQEYYWNTFAGPAAGTGYADGPSAVAHFDQPDAIAADSGGNYYVADRGTNTIRKIDMNGNVTTLAGAPLSAAGFRDGKGVHARFSNPVAIAVAGGSNVYVADQDNYAVRKIAADGTVTTLAGGTYGSVDGSGTGASFGILTGIAVDSGSNVYVSDRALERIRRITPDGTVTTLAGNGTGGYLDASGTNAKFNNPEGIVVDGSGNLYVADEGNNVVREIGPGGIVTTLAGAGPGFSGTANGVGTNSEFAGPGALTLDGSGNLYVVDTGYGDIRKITSNGTVTTLTRGDQDNSYGTLYAVLYNPVGLAADSTGNVYVADTGNPYLFIVLQSGSISVFAGASNQVGTNTNFEDLTAITIDSGNNLYVGDFDEEAVLKITPQAISSTLYRNPGSIYGGLFFPDGLAVDSVGDVFADTSTGNYGALDKINPQGGLTQIADILVYSLSLQGIALDSGTNIYVADPDNNSIQFVTLSGSVSTFAGGNGGGYSDGSGFRVKFNSPEGVALDGSGNVYVADQGNNAIRMITQAGTVTTIAGGGPAGYLDGTGTNARFSAPTRLTVDSAGNLFVADTGNAVVRMITRDGTVSTIGGSPGSYLQSQPGLGTASLLQGVCDVCVDGSGNVYAATSGRVAIGVPEQVQTGSVQVLLSPTNAIASGAQWQVDGGPLQSSGAVVTNLLPGVHAIDFNDASLFTTPAGQDIVIAANQTAATSGTYVAIPQAGSLTVTLGPDSAVAAGAQWQVDGGPAQDSNATVGGLSVGYHQLTFSAVPGFDAQSPQQVYIYLNYTQSIEVDYTVSIPTFQITPGAGANGGISPNTAQTADSGSSITFTATPSSGYMVDQWLVSGSTAQTGGNTFTLSDVLANTSVEVTFTLKIYAVTPSAGANGTISPSVAQAVVSGSSATFTATPNSGFAVSQWLVSGSVAQTGGTSFTLSGVTEDSSVQVTFAPGQFFFITPTTIVHNTDGRATIAVGRNSGGAGSVSYQTVDESAIAGVEYTGTQGTLTFGAGQTQATITVPISLVNSAASNKDFSILLSNPSSPSGIGNPSSATVYILNALAGDLTISQTGFTLPTTAPVSTGAITVTLTPAAADGQWRLFGELDWRNSGATATGLTSGNYEVEFKPAAGYQQPGLQVVPVSAGEQANVSGTYSLSAAPATGSLQVILAPQGTGGWRFQGETSWRPSGATVTGLNIGDYILEFEPATGLVTPDNAEAVVVAGQVATVNVTYATGDSGTGQLPVLVSDSVAQTQAPYVFTGEIQTDEGLGSGFVPLDRVVVTAAHVIFDDSTLSYVQGVRWFFQYEQGVYETPAQIPAGSYVLSGYAAQRAIDNTPGVASSASRELDAAALYFLEPAARGGQSGYLGSDSAVNPWLTGGQGKFIAGYPVTGVTPTGRLYATPVVTAAFNNVAGSVFSTTAITSYPGNSGGPVFVRYSDGSFYPAAIYLGGSENTVVHAIDSEVVTLMTDAEASGNGGANNAGGGIIQVSEGLSGVTVSALGNVHVTLGPSGAGSDGAYWELAGDGVKRFSGESVLGLAPGSYTVQFFTSGPGYSPPAPAQANLSVAAGNETDITATYTANAPTITSRTAATVIEGQPFTYKITVTPDATGYSTSSTLPSGLALDGTSGLISGTVSTAVAAGVLPISLQATNASGPGKAVMLTLTVAKPGELTVTANGSGAVPKGYTSPSVQAVGASITLKASPGKGYLFGYWSDADSGQVLSTDETYTFTMPTLLNLRANYVVDPFVTAKGSYLALLQGGTYLDSGFVQMAVTPKGGFSGIFNLGGNSVKVKSTFNNLGQYQGGFTVPGDGAFNASLSVTAGGVLSGTFTTTSNGSQVALKAERIAPQTDQALEGVYTVLLPGVSGTTALPGGNGYGTLTITKTGGVKFSGKLGDGVSATVSGDLDSSGVLPFVFFKAAGKTSGAELLLGSVTFPPAASGTAGTLSWYRGADAKDPVYPAGFSAGMPFITAHYTPPAVNYTSADVALSGGDLVTQIIEPVSIAANDKVTATSPGATRFTLKFTAKTGQFTGSFMFNGTTRAFGGAVLQSGNSGLGVFQEESGQTGAVLLQKTP